MSAKTQQVGSTGDTEGRQGGSPPGAAGLAGYGQVNGQDRDNRKGTRRQETEGAVRATGEAPESGVRRSLPEGLPFSVSQRNGPDEMRWSFPMGFLEGLGGPFLRMP